MKHLVILITLTLTLLTTVFAADPATKHTFTGEVTGVVCQACSEHVKAALKTLPGVESVTIRRGEKPGVHQLTVVTTAGKLTKEDANKALGEQAKTYTITSLAPQP